MTNIYDSAPYLAAYHVALTAIGVLILAVLIQSVLQAPLAFAKEQQAPGAPLKGSHKDFSFRVVRTFLNSIENLPMILGATVLAILMGVRPTWVNGLIVLHVFFRLTFWGVYYSGVGKVAGGPRTLSFIGGWFTNLILMGMTLYAALGAI